MKKGNAIILIGDGLGDRPVAELGGRTPLEAAQRPNMNRLATDGECGLMDPIAPGVRAGSDTAHLAMLGFDPYAVYTGRGPFEAVGIGLDVRQGDVAFRCNFSTVDDNMVVTDRRAGRITEGTDQLAAALNGMQIEDTTVLFKESVAHRAGMVLRGPGLGDKVNDADPHAEGLKVPEVIGQDEASRKTARILNQFIARAYEALREHPVNKARVAQGLPPANIALPRGAGYAPHLGNFDERNHVKSACIVEVGLVKGIAKYLGMDVIDVDGATGGLDTDVEAIGRAVIEAFRTHDFILCNVKGPDVAGHDGKPEAKVAIIEKIDHMLGTVLAELPADTYVVVTGDHSTPCSYGDHSGDPVPILLWGPGVRTDDVHDFGERPCAHGGLGRIRGKDIMSILTGFIGVQEKFGA